MPYRQPDSIVHFHHLRSRPPVGERLFVSNRIEAVIEETASSIADPELRRMFEQCFPNALDTTVYLSETQGIPDAYVITGDIPALWLRDSTNQIWPYLPYIHEDSEIALLFQGLILRQSLCLATDSYANAFDKDFRIWERKYELDSFGSFFRLSAGYYKATQDTTPFTGIWIQAVDAVCKTMLLEQNTMDKDTLPLLFQFKTANGHLHPAIRMEGYGYPGKRCGLVRSLFRPSDDECVFPYLIPANAMVVQALRDVLPLLDRIQALDLLQIVQMLIHTIDEGIRTYGVTTHTLFGKIYAYEVDGYGSSCLMDDPNVPSLLSLPYLGYCSLDDPVYQNTRRFVLSERNPFYAKGSQVSGLTSPHVGVKQKFWPMATIVRALTSTDEAEIVDCLRILKATHGGTYFIHESVDVDDPHKYTRGWFSWANSLFGELILHLVKNHPEILRNF